MPSITSLILSNLDRISRELRVSRSKKISNLNGESNNTHLDHSKTITSLILHNLYRIRREELTSNLRTPQRLTSPSMETEETAVQRTEALKTRQETEHRQQKQEEREKFIKIIRKAEKRKKYLVAQEERRLDRLIREGLGNEDGSW
ncbi:hypothetical protein K432DRAFT_402461 [Lepidopterella palustris CBS 459.81]|uniref:Uncharacterized protein n=1 Tax=Lepidopterella palustris CBS 459.81 TaxID=1314670 RepID=A0A8E2EFP7_9PEZI|nr:hypothetical protein K432DRAFT_402461 [Lepidopterella palustris CBS 459.81]